MTENVNETADLDLEGEETYEVNEEGVAYSSESAPSADAPLRPATIAPAAATGRRKEAVARVRIVPGTGTGPFADWQGSARIAHDDDGAFFVIDLV